MFGMINPKGDLFFKVDAGLKEQFANQSSSPHSKMPYSSVPEEISRTLPSYWNGLKVHCISYKSIRITPDI